MFAWPGSQGRGSRLIGLGSRSALAGSGRGSGAQWAVWLAH